ncbi:SUZ domain-containing protein 1 isoform X1 [Harpegnathos saltator]|uniref:SUZ domain-containing protein 1 isoform X1 n=1 Tax=Harpegnathos saltator TaxID=610380 RepID=UPI0005911671|nr:SUZ domain-containing protein 1 isoform X1 [Harpegnathos saltator]
MDDVLESWEQIEESGALDKKLNSLRLDGVEEELESSRCKTSNSTNTKMIILGDDGIRSQYVPPKPTVKILKRPTADSRGSGDGPLMNGDKPKQPIKSLKQREQEYALARKRIMGEEKSPEEKSIQEINKIQPKSSIPSGSGLPNNIVRMPTGPDGTRGFNRRERSAMRPITEQLHILCTEVNNFKAASDESSSCADHICRVKIMNLSKQRREKCRRCCAVFC